MCRSLRLAIYLALLQAVKHVIDSVERLRFDCGFHLPIGDGRIVLDIAAHASTKKDSQVAVAAKREYATATNA